MLKSMSTAAVAVRSPMDTVVLVSDPKSRLMAPSLLFDVNEVTPKV